MAKILIIGANGQLGTELRHLLDECGIEYAARDAKDMDITDRETVDKQLNQLKPEVIYHCAAYTAVDKAEDEGKEINWKVNEDGTCNLAEAAAKIGAKLVYLSTDYVFDGTKTSEYEVDDPTNPKNEYGKAKLAGEKAIQAAMNDYYIIRTSWVFGKYGKNFVYTMLRLAKDHDRLTVVDDQVGRPTWTRTLAEFMTYLVDHDCEYGVYQLSNEDSCSWYEFASEILKDKDVEIAPVTSEEYPQRAYRPRHSVMSLKKAEATGFVIPTWQDALRQFLAQIEE
ncbi:dTDP-4-dehydrorhamnose reductase [Limosilactobacillus mucosae]|uniref:dTDP-4-dehydrorhamnose reductase n=1 Tax=Limosilactobacillus mucosae TaxID=97478 RepID=UPI000652837F|nr:dTDP-4-dehydrorhamnose reductase [Limosilactobacillus mucosae]